MKTKEQLLEKQAEELAKLERELAIREALKDVPGYDEENSVICIHSNQHASVRLWQDFRTEKKLIDACAVVDFFRDQIIDGEHWNDGCVSTNPPEINSCAKRDNSGMDGSHSVEIKVDGGKGYGPNVNVKFWVRLAGVLCEISCPVGDQWKLVPSIHGKYDSDGHWTGRVDWNPAETQTADSFRKWWSEKPAYSGCYYLADIPNFESWASNHGAVKQETVTT